MTSSGSAPIVLHPLGSGEPIRLTNAMVVVAGYTGRDEEKVREHIAELARIGVSPPPQIPMLYQMPSSAMSTDAAVVVSGVNTSGEVEPVLIRCAGKHYLGVGSDHTDRTMEATDIGESKKACPKPIAPNVLEIPNWDEFNWDACHVRCHVDGVLYQEGSLSGLRRPDDLLRILAERLDEFSEVGDYICYAGTLPLIEGSFVAGRRWDVELTTADGRRLTHSYTAHTEEGVSRMRTGAEYLASLDDGRAVFVDGQRVDDVSTHPAFRSVAHTVAGLFDVAADDANGMQFVAPETGRVANRVFGIPRSREDLAARRAAVETWSRHTHGWVGRSPDHVGSFVAAFAAHPETFATDGERDLPSNVTAFHERVLNESLFVSYAIIPPQVSRAVTDAGLEGDHVQAGVVEETPDGLIIRGAQMLATGGAIADEIFVSCIKPLGPDDSEFAVGFVVPAGAPGLKQYVRRPYAPAATSGFDYPLTSRFDEPDSLLVFTDVLIPWERVFVDRDVSRVRRQFFETGAHVLGNWQAQIRLATKLQFIAGVARRVSQVNGVDVIPSVQEKLGELAALVSVVKSAVLAAEFTAAPDSAGMWLPGKEALYGAMGLQSETYPRVIAILRDLVGGGVLQLPSSVDDLTSPLTAPDIQRYTQSPGVSSEDRVKLFKLAWDIIGSEFAGRQQQYEMFYAGAPFVVKGAYTYRNYNYDAAVAQVQHFTEGYKAESV